MDTEKLIIPSGTSNDGLLGGGGIGALLIGALLFGGGFGGFGNRGGWGNGWGGGPAASAVATDITLNPAFQSLGQQIQTLQGQVGANDLRNEMESVENTFATISSGQTAANASNFANVIATLGNLQTAQAAGNFTTLQSINALGRDITAQANQNALQQLNSFNILTTTTLQGFNNQAMQTQNATNQIIAQGTALSSQLAACCCDIQKAISADGDETRALINSINLANIQGQLNDAKNQISNFNQTQTILNALSPRPAVTAVV